MVIANLKPPIPPFSPILKELSSLKDFQSLRFIFLWISNPKVDESYTSQRCPHCGHQVEIVDETRLRVLFCPGCLIYHHRDILGSHNQANRLYSLVNYGYDPEYLRGNTTNEDETGDGDTDVNEDIDIEEN